jgi:hypothetical protein
LSFVESTSLQSEREDAAVTRAGETGSENEINIFTTIETTANMKFSGATGVSWPEASKIITIHYIRILKKVLCLHSTPLTPSALAVKSEFYGVRFTTNEKKSLR